MWMQLFFTLRTSKASASMNCTINTRNRFLYPRSFGISTFGRQHNNSRSVEACEAGEWFVANSLNK